MLDTFMSWFGYGLCHQLPERSFTAGGLQVPVCARDTGIYIGFVVSLALIAALHRGERPTGFPGRIAAAVMVLFGGLMAWDGVTSYAGFRTTTNDLRLLTGLAMGFAMAAIVSPILNDEIWERAGQERVLSPAWRLVAWAAFLPVAFLVVRELLPLLGGWFAVVVALAILATLASINLVVIGMLPVFERRGRDLMSLWPAILVALVVAFIEVWLSGLLRDALTALVG